MANDREEAEKAYRFAEERFVAGALRSARNAKRLFASLPALQNAAAAYEVHAAVAAAARGGRNWYAVLGLPSDATHEDMKKQYKRLCLVLHPDKNRSAAADGAFKLLQQAWEALSARHPPVPASASKPSRAPPPRAPPFPGEDGLSREPTTTAGLAVVRLHAAARARRVDVRLQGVAGGVRARQRDHLLRALRHGVRRGRRQPRQARREVPLVWRSLQPAAPE